MPKSVECGIISGLTQKSEIFNALIVEYLVNDVWAREALISMQSK